MASSVITNSTVLITGGNGGIGFELAKLFAQNGLNLVLVARDAERLASAAEELKKIGAPQVLCIAKDLSKEASPTEIYQEVKDRGTHVNILVNNAGFGMLGPFLGTDASAERRMLQVNMIALTALTRLFVRDMAARGNGSILNLGSTGSFAPTPYNAVYCATKAYVLSFSEALAEELRDTGVMVTTLCPGATATEFAKRANMTDTVLFHGSVMNTADVARIGFDALMRRRTLVVAGIQNKIMVFMLRLMPRCFVTKTAKKVVSKI